MHPKARGRPAAGKGRGLLAKIFSPPALTPGRIRFAFVVAVTGDLVQVAASLFDGWTWLGQAVTIVVAALTIPAVGIRLLTLLTLALELVPAADVLPMWTACIALVVALRKGE